MLRLSVPNRTPRRRNSRAAQEEPEGAPTRTPAPPAPHRAQRLPPPRCHAAFHTTWQFTTHYAPSLKQAQTHTDPSPCPLRPGLSIGAAAERATCRPCQPSPSLSPAGFFQPKPPSLCCNLWKLVSDASSRHSIFIYLFSCRRDPPGGRAAAGTGQARRCRDSEAEDGGKRTPEPSARSSGPASRQGP